MKAFATLAAAILGMAGLASAHMEMKNPPPFRSKFNSHTTDIDYSMTNPLSRDGSDFPCKGYHKLMGTPQGVSVANWSPGQALSMTVTGGTPHNGGSCQASLSYDRGITWTAIHTYYGNCPVVGDSSYTFTLPNDTPAGEALFAWTWFNQIGNREMYMNCAVVTIGGGKRDVSPRGPQDSFSSRPRMFVANVGNGCSTTEGADVQFPYPGPDVTNNSNKLALPVGSCGSREAPSVKRSTSVLPSATVPFEAPFRKIPTATPVPSSSSVGTNSTIPILYKTLTMENCACVCSSSPSHPA